MQSAIEPWTAWSMVDSLQAAVSHSVLGPEPHEDVEVALEVTPLLLEGHAHRVELAGVSARRDPEDEAAARDHVEAVEGLGRHHRVAQRQHQDPGAELDRARPRGHRAQHGDGVHDGEGGLHAQEHVIPGPERLEAEGLGALRVRVEALDVRHLAGAHEVANRQAEVCQRVCPSVLAVYFFKALHLRGPRNGPRTPPVADNRFHVDVSTLHPMNWRFGSSMRRIASSSSVGGLVVVRDGLTRTSKPVFSRTWSTVAPGCRARSCMRRLSASKPKMPSVVTTRETPPKSRPWRRRESPPSR